MIRTVSKSVTRDGDPLIGIQSGFRYLMWMTEVKYYVVEGRTTVMDSLTRERPPAKIRDYVINEAESMRG